MKEQFVLHRGDCLASLRTMADCSIDACITDPPYGLSNHTPADVIACLTAWLAGEEYRPNKKGFMGRTWDSWVPGPEVWREVFRVLKPGGHVITFAGSRTHDLMSIALRLAGFECRDTVMDLYATSSAARAFIDSLDDAQRKALAQAFPADAGVLWGYATGYPKSMNVAKQLEKIPPENTPDEVECMADRDEWLEKWSGWGTALKPAFEPALLFRKPLVGTVAENVLAHGTGALNIDGCRVPFADYSDAAESKGKNQHATFGNGARANKVYGADTADRTNYNPPGRFPANLIHDGSPEVLALFPDSNGAGGSVPRVKVSGYGDGIGTGTSDYLGGERIPFNAGTGSAARFFYCAKASKQDRSEGCDALPPRMGGMVSNTSGQHISRRDDGYKPQPRGNYHPTVKPTDLMRYLCRLVTPQGGVVLDPFTGSSSTGKAAILEGFRFIGCELDEDEEGNPLGYFEIATARIQHAIETVRDRSRQPSLFGEEAA